MTKTTTQSWWVGLSRDELRTEIAKREEGWHAQKVKYLDHIGARMVSDLAQKRRDA